MPGTQDKEIGGRILFEYNIRPVGAEELVSFDCARQKKARPYEFNDFMNTLTPLTAIPFPFETGGNNETANDDGNNISDEDQEPTEGLIYSADRPGNYMIEPASTDMGFKVNKLRSGNMSASRSNPAPCRPATTSAAAVAPTE